MSAKHRMQKLLLMQVGTEKRNPTTLHTLLHVIPLRLEESGGMILINYVAFYEHFSPGMDLLSVSLHQEQQMKPII